MADKNHVPSLLKANRILSYIGQHRQVAFTPIYKDLGLPKSSTYSILATLEHLGFVRQTPSGEYALGLKLFEIGSIAADSIDLRTEARPFVKNLANEVQLTTHLGILQGIRGIYLVKEEIEHQLKITSWEGKQIRLLSSGIGKALLAWQQQDIIEDVLINTPIEAHTTKTITAPESIREELARIRERGWAADDEEDGWGVRCVASCVRDVNGQVVASLSVCGTSHQVPVERFESLAKVVIEACNNLSKALGYNY